MPPARRGPWPAGLLGLLALVAGVEATLIRHDLAITTEWMSRFQWAARTVDREAPGSAALFFGDSLVKHGLLPSIFEDRAGLRAYNLALSGGQPPEAEALLARALAAGARPRLIVFAFDPFTLMSDPRVNVRVLAEVLDPAAVARLARAARDPALVPATIAARLLASYKDRFELRVAISAALRGEAFLGFGPVHAFWRNWRANRGAEVRPPKPAVAGVDAPLPDESAYCPDSWSCHWLNAIALARFLDRADASGARLVWLLPPTRPRLQSRREAIGLDARFDRFVTAVQGRYPSLTVLDARRAGADPAAFLDSVHLDGRGAVALSTAVVDALPHPDAKRRRRIDLRLPETSPWTGRVEDLERSRARIASESGRTRR